jgi:putative NIF3 family GTP cyclohydrolase 1 type 2
VDCGKPVHKVAVGGGSCGSDLPDAVKAGCDTFVTADVKYNQFRDALSCGINIIDAGHFHTENPVCAVVAEKLRAAFPETEIILSKKLNDPMKFF